MSEVVDIKTGKEVEVKEVKNDNKIKIVLGNLQIVAESLNFLLLAPKGINGTAYFAIKRVLTKITEDNNSFNDARKEIINKYCVFDKDKNPVIENNNYKIKVSKQDQFNTEFNELASTAIEYDFVPISISKINDMPINAYTAAFFKE